MTQSIMPLKVMYNEVNRVKTHGIEGYDFQKKYFDPIEQINKRKYLAQKKGQKSNKHVTKRGNYLTDHSNMTKGYPAPGQYQHKEEWITKSKTVRSLTKKKTYLDELIQHAKKEKIPAPGQYNTIKTEAQVQQELKKLKSKKPGEKHNTTYLDQIQYASNCTPGPGAYNPRKIKPRIKQNMKKPEDWRKKSMQASKKKIPQAPDMGTYNPVPADFQVFASIKDEKNSKQSLWGKQKRFDLQGNKKQGKGKPPGPGQYQLIHQWKGKDTKGKKQRDYMQFQSKTISKSVYY